MTETLPQTETDTPFTIKVDTTRWVDALLFFAILTLPLTSALTIDLKFPFKIYEITLILVLALLLLKGKISYPRAMRREFKILGAFVLLSAILLMAIMSFPTARALGNDVTYRFGPVGDGIAALFYLIFAAINFFLFSIYAYRKPNRYIKAWLLGALLVSIYAQYLFFAKLLDIRPMLISGTSPQLIYIGGRGFIRGGTFLEGNHFGLYLLLSTCIAVYAKRRKLAFFLMLTTLTTFSTIAFAGLGLFVLMSNWTLFPK